MQPNEANMVCALRTTPMLAKEVVVEAVYCAEQLQRG
jgi:hypothetical protein